MTDDPLPTCKECADFIADYLEDELDESTKKAFERHLALCPPCVGYLDSYRETIRRCKDAVPDPSSPEKTCSGKGAIPPELIQAIAAAAEKADPRPDA